jgi:hypothetical protein
LKLKILEETVEEKGIGNDFLNRTPVAKEIRARSDKWDCIKLKSFFTAKETITRVKRQPTEWQKIFASHSFYKRLISRIYQEIKKLNTKRTNNTINKGASEQTVLKSTIANKCVKKFATSPAIGEMQIQTPFHLTPVSLVITKKTSSKY